jgi:VanZ family protein
MKRLRLVSALLWTVIILVLCWTPQIYLPVDERPDSWKIILHLDKVVHLGIFAVFSVLWLRALPGGKRRFFVVAIAGLVLAVVTEVVQNVPIIQREGEVQDAVADFSGVLLGFPLFLWIEKCLDMRRSRHAGVEVAEAQVTQN